MSVDGALSRLNPLVVALLRSPLHRLASGGLLVLSYTGRKSGRRYRIPLGYQRDGDDLVVMVSEARRKTWWRNFRTDADADAELWVRGRPLPAHGARVDPESADFAALVEATLRRVPGMARVFGVAGWRRGAGLDEAQLAGLRREVAVVRFRPRGAAGRGPGPAPAQPGPGRPPGS